MPRSLFLAAPTGWLTLFLLPLALLTLPGCQPEDEEITSANSGYQVEGAEDDDSTADLPSGDTLPPGTRMPPSGNARQAGAGSDSYRVTELQESAQVELDEDLLTIPENDDELLEYFERLIAYQPEIHSEQEYYAVGAQLMPVIDETAARVLALEGISEDQQSMAIVARIQALAFMNSLEMPGADEKIEAFAQELANSDDPNLAMFGTITQLQLQEAPDGNAAIEKVSDLLAEEEHTRELFLSLQNTSSSLQELGFEEDALRANLILGEAFRDHEDPEVSSHARFLLAEHAVSQLLEKGDRESVDYAQALAEESLGMEVLSDGDFASALYIASMLERTSYASEAQQIFQAMQQQLAEHKATDDLDSTGEVQALVEESLARLEANVNALGQPLELTGVYANGEPFDWSAYQGKVVLVDFWANWCPPCVAELPNLVELHEKYHDQGFDILGVNFDQEPRDLSGYPGRNLVATGPAENSLPTNPNALRYQVDQLPYTMLIDRQGNVVVTRVRGQRLEEEIERLLAEPAPNDDARHVPQPQTWYITQLDDTEPADEISDEELGPEQVTQAPPLARPADPQEAYSLLPEGLREIPTGSQEERLEFFENVQAFTDVAARQPNAGLIIDQLLPLRRELALQLLAEELSEERRLEVLDFHIDTLRVLSISQPEKTREEFNELAETLAASEVPAEVDRAGRIRFFLAADTLSESPEADPENLLAELTILLENQAPTAELYQVVRSVPQLLQSMNYAAESEQALEIICASFLNSSEPEIVRTAAYEIINREFTRLFEPGGPEPAQNILKATLTFMHTGELGPQEWQNVVQVAEALEYTGNIEQSQTLLEKIQELLAELPEPTGQEALFRDSLTSHVSDLEARLADKSSMLGQPFLLQGEYLLGDSFDWSDYRGKVVLVNYWASTDEYSLELIANINETYHEYHELGLEVIGVNLDEDLEVARRYSIRYPTYWKSIVAPPADDQQGEQTNRAYYEGPLPYSLLIDREGNVVVLQPHGETLDTTLAELLGIEDEPAAAPDEEAPAEEAPPEEGARQSAEPVEWFIALATDDALADATEEGSDEETALTDEEEPAEPGDSIDVFDESINPYVPPPGLSKLELLEYILDMTELPVSIQSRTGFNAGLVAACDELLAQEPTGRSLLVATKTRLIFLHRDAGGGNEDAQARLVELAEDLAADLPENADEELRAQVAFYLIEARALEVDDLAEEDLPTLLADIKTYMVGRELGEPHLRLASQTIRAINRLPEEERETYFQEFGSLWAESDDRQLARYGRRIADTPAEPAQPQQVGRLLAGTGIAADGTALDLSAYRGQVLIVDFWATWCGPCIAELPNVEATYRELHDDGLELVGISLDQDMQALSDFLEEHALPWPTMAGKESAEIATEYGVQGIPTLMLIDREGNIVAVAHSIGPLREQAIALLETPAEVEAEPAEEPTAEPTEAE